MASWYDPFGVTEGLFNDPYKDASKKYEQYMNKGINYQKPYYDAGVNALAPYQQNLQKMSDPQGYYNSIMGGYQESPYARYEQQSAMNAANNAASASGLAGSTPMAMQMQQNAEDISSRDMDKYFQNLYGINTDYMSGLNNLIGGGQNSANAISNMYTGGANNMGNMAYASSTQKKQQLQQLLSLLAFL